MPVFKLYADSLYPAWYRDHYTVEAESIEEAIQMIKDYEVEPDESEPLYEFEETPLEFEIRDAETHETLYHEKDDSRQL